ncbi:hypothetical protein EE612_058809 [Oryza sativa]|nr:hypothetical protein EE612_058809 [Oryza sativa]
MRVAVVGAGVSGLAAAHELATSCAGGVDVTVYEKEDSLGGSFARTVGVDGGAGGEVVHLHLGFMPFNSVPDLPIDTSLTTLLRRTGTFDAVAKPGFEYGQGANMTSGYDNKQK